MAEEILLLHFKMEHRREHGMRNAECGTRSAECGTNASIGPRSRAHILIATHPHSLALPANMSLALLANHERFCFSSTSVKINLDNESHFESKNT